MSTSVERFRSGGRFEDVASYSRAIRVGDLILVSGCAPIGRDGALLHPGDPYLQTSAAIEIALSAVAELGGDRSSVVRTRLMLSPDVPWEGPVRAHGEAFRGVDPSNTTVFVAGFIPEGVLVEVEIDAVAMR